LRFQSVDLHWFDNSIYNGDLAAIFAAQIVLAFDPRAYHRNYVLSARPKITDLSFHLFARSLHPELFNRGASKTFERENYRLQVHITTDGHWISFENKHCLLSEVSSSSHHPLPTGQTLISHAVEVEFEIVAAKTFVTIQQQLGNQKQCDETNGLVYRFESNGRLSFGAVSYVDVQSFINHVRVRAFHTYPDTCGVLKSESTFRIV